MCPRLYLTGRLCCAWKGRIKPLWRCLRKLKAPEGIGLGSGCFRKMRIRENMDFAGDDFRKE